MAVSISTAELRNMQIEDLQKDVRAQRALVRKLSIGLRLQKEKDTAKYRREKKMVARMMTVLSELEKKTARATLPRLRS